MLKKFRNNDKGFTLIELLIVVAIIGILAAIAIPQFAAYRTRGFNAAANSDVRNVATAQEALFADTQGFGSIASAALAAGAAAVGPSGIQVGPQNGAIAGTAGTMVQNAQGAVPFALSNGVRISGSNTITAAPIRGLTYVIVSSHVQGDSCFGRDSDSTGMFRSPFDVATAGAGGFVTNDVPASVVNAVDLVAAGTGNCTAWAIQ